jgi:hypothetical protein
MNLGIPTGTGICQIHFLSRIAKLKSVVITFAVSEASFASRIFAKDLHNLTLGSSSTHPLTWRQNERQFNNLFDTKSRRAY